MATLSHTTEDPDDLLERAQQAFRTGDALGAWSLCERAAEIGRERGDATVIARAALIVRGLAIGPVVARVNSLCREALARLGDDDESVLRARVYAQLAATTDLWGALPDGHPANEALARAEASGDPEAVLLALHAQRAAIGDPANAQAWIDIGGRVIELGLAIGELDEIAWGRFCRADAYWILGDRVGLENEMRALGAELRPEHDPTSVWRLTLLRAASPCTTANSSVPGDSPTGRSRMPARSASATPSSSTWCSVRTSRCGRAPTRRSTRGASASSMS